MGAIAFTLVGKSQNKLVYSFTGDSAGTLTYATWSADAIANSGLAQAAAVLAGTCDSDAKADIAISGFSAAGAAMAAGGIVVSVPRYTAVTTAKAPVTVVGKDSGAGNNPDILVTPDAATTGILEILHMQSIVD